MERLRSCWARARLSLTDGADVFVPDSGLAKNMLLDQPLSHRVIPVIVEVAATRHAAAIAAGGATIRVITRPAAALRVDALLRRPARHLLRACPHDECS